jgi:cytochrome c2
MGYAGIKNAQERQEHADLIAFLKAASAGSKRR